MRTSSSRLIRPACLYGLLALSVWVLASPGSAVADNTNPAGAQTRPESPGQVKPGPNAVQGSSTFTPAQPGTTPGGAATGTINTNKEK
jgi:hypothetical protein